MHRRQNFHQFHRQSLEIRLHRPCLVGRQLSRLLSCLQSCERVGHYSHPPLPATTLSHQYLIAEVLSYQHLKIFLFFRPLPANHGPPTACKRPASPRIQQSSLPSMPIIISSSLATAPNKDEYPKTCVGALHAPATSPKQTSPIPSPSNPVIYAHDNHDNLTRHGPTIQSLLQLLAP